MKLIIKTVIFVLSMYTLFSQAPCYPCPDAFPQPITYTVNQINCGLCTYTVYFEEGCPGTFIIKEIRASSSNPPCCLGTAINDPIVSGYILDEAANQIVQQNGGTATIYTPSRCWQWEGYLGPDPLHNAVLVPCSNVVSCCVYEYSGGVLENRAIFGIENCRANS